MRYLAIARFRLLSIIRTATPIFALAAIPPLFALLFESAPEASFRSSAEVLLGEYAGIALKIWIIHGLFMMMACIASGTVKLPHDGLVIVVPSDLMDTAPVGPDVRFWGEALGTFGAMLTIHLCCLPLLAGAAVLSPLPTSMFLWMEAGIIMLMALASAGGAWQRRARRTRYSATRGVRNTLVVAILLLLIVPLTTRWREFRDAVGTFFLYPSTRGWANVTWTVENPLLMFVLVALLYAGTIAYYYSTSMWDRARD
ncbi:MAG TPA: hypothetical protein VFB20_05515 [Burkholderiales bacterium]|nr:hypothetical protein [Burkholderiales bacterium]